MPLSLGATSRNMNAVPRLPLAKRNGNANQGRSFISVLGSELPQKHSTSRDVQLQARSLTVMAGVAGVQKYSFRAACMSRGELLSLVICPNAASPNPLSGVLNQVRFRALNISQRNCSRYRSRNGKFLENPRSRLLNPGPVSRFLAESPKVPGAFAVKAAVLKYSFSQWFLDPWC